MKRLLWLYPRAWRARYQAEVSAMLEACHLSWRDVLNLVMGAVDARLNPQTSGAEGRRWTRALGVASLVAAGVFLYFPLWHLRWPIPGYGTRWRRPTAVPRSDVSGISPSAGIR